MITIGIVLVTQAEPSPYGNASESTHSTTAKDIKKETTDEHGCLTDIGYSWCEPKQKCLVLSEEACESTSSIKPDTGEGEIEDVPEETTEDSWKIYANTEYNYSFEIPEDCVLGALPAECKAVPPEMRPEECLCFLNSQDLDNILFQTYTGQDPQLTLATMNVTHYGSELYNPPEGAELVPWVTNRFAHEDIPQDTNYEIAGVPALKLYSPGGQGTYSSENYYFITNGMLFNISLVDVDDENNRELYDHMIESFTFN